jgi:hypothetical protein
MGWVGDKNVTMERHNNIKEHQNQLSIENMRSEKNFLNFMIFLFRGTAKDNNGAHHYLL